MPKLIKNTLKNKKPRYTKTLTGVQGLPGWIPRYHPDPLITICLPLVVIPFITNQL